MYEQVCCYCMNDDGEGTTCSQCGNQRTLQNANDELRCRSLLHHQYLIGRRLGRGGFGITYLALCLNTQKKMAIKEFFPNAIASRSSDTTTVQPTATDLYDKGLSKFLDEAQILRRFHHLNIVPIDCYFEENNTAYLVMPYVQGKTLLAYMKQTEHGLSEKELLEIMIPILEGLKEIHTYNFLHRDVDPSNIYLPENHPPLLLDFGAARQFLINENKELSMMVAKGGYTPPEQYLSIASKQGAYSDIYACAATIYACLRGYDVQKHSLRSPIPSPDRQTGAVLPHIKNESKHPLSEHFANAIMKGLSLISIERPQSVLEFQQQLLGISEACRIELCGLDETGDYAGCRIPIAESLIIGKDERKCHIVLNDNIISKTHCHIVIKNGVPYLEDLHSTNGTMLNDKKIPACKQVQLHINDTFILAGKAVFQIVKSQESVTKAPVISDAQVSTPPKGASNKTIGIVFGIFVAVIVITVIILYITHVL